MSPNVSFSRLPLDDDLRLRDLLVESVGNFEPELRVVGGLLPIGGTRTLDLVGVDGQSRLALLEVRCQERPEWILEILDHYDWACLHIDEVARLYPQHSIDAARRPRLIVVTAAFSEEFRRRVMYLEGAPVELVEYRYLEVNGVRGLYFEPLAAPAGRALAAQPSLQTHLDRMASGERSLIAERLVARVAGIDPGVRLQPHRGGVLALWEERLLARLEFSRQGVWVSDEVGGEGSEVRRMGDLEPALSRLAARVAHWKRIHRPVAPRPAAGHAAPTRITAEKAVARTRSES